MTLHNEAVLLEPTVRTGLQTRILIWLQSTTESMTQSTLVKASLGEFVTLPDAAILLETILVESVTLQDASTTQKPTSDRAAL